MPSSDAQPGDLVESAHGQPETGQKTLVPWACAATGSSHSSSEFAGSGAVSWMRSVSASTFKSPGFGMRPGTAPACAPAGLTTRGAMSGPGVANENDGHGRGDGAIPLLGVYMAGESLRRRLGGVRLTSRPLPACALTRGITPPFDDSAAPDPVQPVARKPADRKRSRDPVRRLATSPR